MILWMIASALAEPEVAPEAPPVPDLVESFGGGVTMNWTKMSLRVTASAEGRGVNSSQKTVEQQARLSAEPALAAAMMKVQVDAQNTCGDLLEEPSYQGPLQARLARWSVVETRYFSSGRIEIDGELPVREVLIPWTIEHAQASPPVGQKPETTGVVVDARGLGVSPACSPKLLTEKGEVLYDGALWVDTANSRLPVIYVPAPTHADVARAGEHPSLFKAAQTRGVDLVLSEADVRRFREDFGGTRLLGEGTVVLVVDAENL